MSLPCLDDVRRLIADTLRPAHFFVADRLQLQWEHVPAETVSWEVFRGRLLDPAYTREQRTFEAWNIHILTGEDRSAEPLLSVKLDAASGQVHVVRAILCYAWEGYHAGGNVYLSRETQKWLRELVGTIDLKEFVDTDAFRSELVCLLFQAVVGTSRLPLTSLEAPLPAFSFGELAYVYPLDLGPDGAGPMTTPRELIARGLSPRLPWARQVKLLEAVLRATPVAAVADVACLFAERWAALSRGGGELIGLLRALFNDVSLSPSTEIVDRALQFVASLENAGYLTPAQVTDFLGHLLRQIGRHLTAYDLVIFHHRGANYPDALLLDAVLAAYLHRLEKTPTLFLDRLGDDESERHQKRLRRRGLRQAWLLRRRYEGHAVPDVPTSPGENMRVLPPPYRRLPEEQILQPAKRSRRLFADTPLEARLGEQAQAVLRQALSDLQHPHELRELGMALYLDRPLGACKAPGEPDQTLLLSYEAFSRSLAVQRLDFLKAHLEGLVATADWENYRRRLREMPVSGVPVRRGPETTRPGVVSLADARRAADDFILLRTTSKAIGDFLAQYDVGPLAACVGLEWLAADRRVVIVRDVVEEDQAKVVLAVYDAALRKRIELVADTACGYHRRGGVEYPRGGLCVQRLWDEDGQAVRSHPRPIVLRFAGASAV